MIDLSQLTEKFSGLSEAAGGIEALGGLEGVQQMLADAGIDPAELSNLSAADLSQLLEQTGIDPAQFLEGGQLGELGLGEVAQQLLGQNFAGEAGEAGANGGLGEIVEGLVGRFFGR